MISGISFLQVLRAFLGRFRGVPLQTASLSTAKAMLLVKWSGSWSRRWESRHRRLVAAVDLKWLEQAESSATKFSSLQNRADNFYSSLSLAF